uniref:Uncharacterized protein n=1 Tax=Circular ssDNA virus sp. TaxID=2805939 RepID=A0A894JTC3_9VIRU|nr:hypothetical protein [Circular ssDNA virus sp.]
MSQDFDVFDPFSDYCPDFSQYGFDESSSQVLDPYGNPYDTTILPSFVQSVEQGSDPQVTLRSMLEQEFQSQRREVTDPTDVMPQDAPVFKRIDDNSVIFYDVSFAGPTLRSEQQCKTKDLQGFIILPARYCTTVRSRAGNHSHPTPALYLKEVDPSISAQFE